MSSRNQRCLLEVVAAVTQDRGLGHQDIPAATLDPGPGHTLPEGAAVMQAAAVVVLGVQVLLANGAGRRHAPQCPTGDATSDQGTYMQLFFISCVTPGFFVHSENTELFDKNSD